MLDALLNLPALLGCLIVMITFVVVGLAVRFVSEQILFQGEHEALRDSTRTIFLAVNLILGLFISLSLHRVVDQMTDIENEVVSEAVAIAMVPAANGLFSNIPIGPFQKIV